jgi:hypothetical protein
MKKFFYLFLLLCSPFTIEAATITVTSGADAGAGTLRAAIASAVAGDDIAFSGVTTVTLTSAELLINKNLTINGGTGVTITRSGAIEFRIFNISSATTVVLNKLSITNGKATGQAGGIQNTANLTLNDCIITNNEAPQGGGLQNDGTLTMNRCFVHSNRDIQKGAGSGLVIYGSSTTLNNCVFTNNQGAPAIGLQSSGSLTVTNCTIAKNAGIGINIANGSTTLNNTIVAENTGTHNIKNNVSASSAYNLIGTEVGNGGLINGTNNNKVGISPQFANSSDPDGVDDIFGTTDDGLIPLTCSPALNAGNNTNAPSGTDIAGNQRIFATTVDIGAYEFQASSIPPSTITLSTAAILVGATTFTIPYTATTGSPTTYSISGTGITTVTDAALPNSPISVNLTAPASSNLSFTLTVKNAGGCTNSITGSVSVTKSVTWTGAVSTDWNTPNNWSPSFVPTATVTAIINDVTNDPVILSGTTANCLRMDIGNTGALTINSGGSLTVATDVVTLNRGINIFTKGTLTNNGVLTISTNTSVALIALSDSSTFNNSGTVVLNSAVFDITLGGPNSIVNNTASGIINFRTGRGFHCLNGTTGNIITNQGTMNYSGTDYFAVLNPNFTLNNSGIIDVKSGQGIAMQGGTLNNLACGKTLMPTVQLDNSAAISTTTNAGAMVLGSVINTNGIFNNTGVTNRLPTVGTFTNTGNGAVHIRNSTTPIFAYGGTFNGTINGIFTDSLATVSAGTFANPNTFTPLATLPKTSQTLFAKITPSGGACSYIVPFTYNNVPSSTKDLSNIVKLHQNRPNPFSQETVI